MDSLGGVVILDLLNWATVAVSLANTVLLLWLGFTILLNAERRTWGIWLISAGLLVQGVAWLKGDAIREFLREQDRS